MSCPFIWCILHEQSATPLFAVNVQSSAGVEKLPFVTWKSWSSLPETSIEKNVSLCFFGTRM